METTLLETFCLHGDILCIGKCVHSVFFEKLYISPPSPWVYCLGRRGMHWLPKPCDDQICAGKNWTFDATLGVGGFCVFQNTGSEFLKLWVRHLPFSTQVFHPLWYIPIFLCEQVFFLIPCVLLPCFVIDFKYLNQEKIKHSLLSDSVSYNIHFPWKYDSKGQRH